jgi:hypothetical protein
MATVGFDRYNDLRLFEGEAIVASNPFSNNLEFVPPRFFTIYYKDRHSDSWNVVGRHGVRLQQSCTHLYVHFRTRPKIYHRTLGQYKSSRHTGRGHVFDCFHLTLLWLTSGVMQCSSLFSFVLLYMYYVDHRYSEPC